MLSQDSEGESYVADYLADPKVCGDLDHDGWTSKEEEDYEPKVKEETSSDKDKAPLTQPGDMHVEFKKSSLPDRAKKPKIEFIPFRLLQENKQELCKRILSLEQEIDDPREQNSILKHKLRKKPTSSTTPSPSPLKKETYMGMGTPLGNFQAWERCPGIVSSSHSYLYRFTYFDHFGNILI